MTTQTAITRENLAALESAIAQGVTSVSYDGSTVSYRKLEDMMKIREWMQDELGIKKRARPRPRRGVVHL